MDRAAAVWIHGHNDALISPRSGRARACSISDSLRETGWIYQIVKATAFIEPGTFFVIRPERRVILSKTTYGTAVRNHIGVELYPVEDIVSPIEVRLSVIVDEYRRARPRQLWVALHPVMWLAVMSG